LGGLVIFMTSTVYPVWLTYSYQRQQRRQAVTFEKIDKLQDLMRIPAAVEVFTKFTDREFCSG
jgi:hypothetical protein